MNYHNSIRIVSQAPLDTKIRQQLRRKKALGLPGGTALWLAASKIALAVVFVVFCINLWLNFTISRGEQHIQAIEAARYQLKEDQIVLLVTGHGLKDIPSTLLNLEIPVAVEPDLDAVERVISI